MPSDDLPGLLRSVADAIRSGALDTAEDRLDEVEVVYEEIDAPERRKQRKATVGRDRTDIDSETRETLDEFAQAVNASDLGRAGLLAAVAIYLSDPTQTDADEIASKLERQAEIEATLVELEEALDDALVAVDLRALLLIADADVPGGVQPKGTPFQIDVTVQNVGDDPAEGVSLSQDSGADVAPGTISLGTLTAEAEGSGTFTVPAEQDGEFTLDLRAEGDPGQPGERTERFRIVDKESATEIARGAVGDLVGRIEESDQFTGGPAKLGIRILEEAGTKLEDARQLAGQGQAGRANDELDEGARVVGGFLNYMNELAGSSESPPPELVRSIKTLAEGVTDRIALAREAEV